MNQPLRFEWRSIRVEEWFYRLQILAAAASILGTISALRQYQSFVDWWAWGCLVLVVAFLAGLVGHAAALALGLVRVRKL